MRTNLGIQTIDPTTGAVLDTFPAPGNLTALKYDPGSNILYGLYSVNNSQIALARIDLTTGQNNPYQIPGVGTYVVNSTVFDRSGLRYMFRTLSGIMVLNVNTLNLSGPFPVQGNYSNLVYDPANNAVIGGYDKNQNQQFWMAKVDLATGTFSDIGPMAGVRYVVAGAAAFDSGRRRYITVTDNGIEVFDADNANTLKTFPTVGNLGEFQFFQSESPLVSSLQTGTCSNNPLTLRAEGDFDQYIWSDGYQGQSRTITDGGNYSVTGIRNGQNYDSGQRWIDDEGPARPQIHFANGELWGQSNHSLQWFHDGVPIPGATQANLIPAVIGSYTVRASMGNGCYKDSDPYVVTITAAAEGPESAELELFPNPAQDVFRLRSENSISAVRIMNLSGQLLKSIEVGANRNDLEVRTDGLAEGVYLLEIDTRTEVLRKKLIVGQP